MIGLRSSLLWAPILLVSFTFNNLSEASDHKKLPSAVVVGTVYCDTCFHQDFSKSSHFISGASVAVECGDRSSRTSFREVVKTNEHGEFKVQLPFSVSKHVKKIKGCSVKLISSSEPYCAVASAATSSSIGLKSWKEGTHIFSAGFFTFKPLKQPELCDQKRSIPNPKKLSAAEMSSISNPNDPTFVPPIQDPPSSDLPPVGQNYLPRLPPLPNLPPLPKLPPLPALPGLTPYFPPVPTGASSKESRKASEIVSNEEIGPRRPFNLFPFFPPNPLLPPPSLLPPNPLQPPPSILPPIFPSPPPSIFPPIFPSPPSLFPPVFPTPPPSIFPPVFPRPGSPPPFRFPPLIPGLTPSPPPPPSSFLPPFPFQPTPGFPGVPPAVPSSSSKKSTP